MDELVTFEDVHGPRSLVEGLLSARRGLDHGCPEEITQVQIRDLHGRQGGQLLLFLDLRYGVARIQNHKAHGHRAKHDPEM